MLLYSLIQNICTHRHVLQKYDCTCIYTFVWIYMCVYVCMCVYQANVRENAWVGNYL
jgi:hypothetical protein